MSNQVLTDLLSNLEKVNELKKQYKKLSSIYQCEAKQNTALWFNLPIATYYDYSYKEWLKASHRMSEFLEQMSQHRVACGQWLGYSVLKTPYREWRDDFVRYCNATDIGQKAYFTESH